MATPPLNSKINGETDAVVRRASRKQKCPGKHPGMMTYGLLSGRSAAFGARCMLQLLPRIGLRQHVP
jgi:hypothetical protein